MAYIDPDDYWSRGVEDAVEVQRRLNAINKVMAEHMRLVFGESENPDWPVEGFTLYEDILDAEVVY